MRDVGQQGMQPVKHGPLYRWNLILGKRQLRELVQLRTGFASVFKFLCGRKGLRKASVMRHRSLPINRTQMAKSVYSGVTASVGAESIPAATVALVPCSIKMNEPVK